MVVMVEAVRFESQLCGQEKEEWEQSKQRGLKKLHEALDQRERELDELKEK